MSSFSVSHKGKIVSQGTFAELSKSGVNFSELLKLSEKDASEMDQGSLINKDKYTPNTDHVTTSESERRRADSISSMESLGKDYVVTMLLFTIEIDKPGRRFFFPFRSTSHFFTDLQDGFFFKTRYVNKNSFIRYWSGIFF